MENNGFYTMKGYLLHEDGQLTTAMEDYLEMITRLSMEREEVRVSLLSRMLHVKASSVTKMVRQLAEAGLLEAQKYGTITLTERGHQSGTYLLHRHDVLHRFLCLVNQTDNELEQVEKIEHFLNMRTVENLELLTLRLEKLE